MSFNFLLIYLYIIIDVSAIVIVVQYSNTSLISNNSYTYINDAFSAISSYNDPKQRFIINFDSSTNIYNLSLNQTNIIQTLDIVGGRNSINRINIHIFTSLVMNSSVAALKLIGLNFNIMTPIQTNIFNITNGSLIIQVIS